MDGPRRSFLGVVIVDPRSRCLRKHASVFEFDVYVNIFAGDRGREANAGATAIAGRENEEISG
jgi:hypothetical protein